MTAFVKNGTTPTVNLVITESNDKLTKWVYEVATEYCDEPGKLFSAPLVDPYKS